MAIYKMSDGALMTINMENYSEDEFIIGAVDFLGTNENTHKIDISEEVFKQYASTVLGKFLVAKVAYGDASGHAEDEVIVGYFPQQQDVRFVRNKKGFLRGIADAVISKQYAPNFCEIFTRANNTRSVSVEMGVEEEPNGNGTTAKRFNIMGVTVLGMSVRPSSPGSNINIKRFEDASVKSDCEKYYKTVWQRLADLEQFSGKTYSVNTTELKETPWGDVDKTELRNKIMEASNRSELVDKVYLKVMDGWEDAPSENLKYPVMELVDNTFYYNKFALASALAYAKQHNESDVVSKVEKLYKKFKLAEEGEEENMSEKFEIEGREAWGDIIAEVQKHEGEDAYVDSVEKDHIIFTIDDVRYRVDADVEVGEDDKTVKANIHWDTKKEDKVQAEAEEDSSDENAANEDDDNSNKDTEDMEKCADGGEDNAQKEECSDGKMDKDNDDECPECDEDDDKCECSKEEMAKKDEKISELENIIMEKDKEIAELKEYKENKECSERNFEVQKTLEELKECVDNETLEALKEEGLACKLSDIDGWKNKAKALAFDNGSRKEMSASIWSMAIPKPIEKKSTSKWDSI